MLIVSRFSPTGSSSFSEEWDFSVGSHVAAQLLQWYGSPIDSGACLSEGFLLLATFSRFTFRLMEEPVGIALKCCLGG